jgi:two-component system, chemotaxis family, response regulator Rcp1
MKSIRILLVEDNPGDVVLVRHALRAHSVEHDLHVARDGEEAIRYLAAISGDETSPAPHVLLLDLNLPRIDGTDVLRELRKHPACNGVRVIVLTSSDSPKDRARMAALGASDYFRKPADFDQFMELGAVVRHVAGESGEASACH